MAREGLDVGGTGRNRSDSRGIGSGSRDNNKKSRNATRPNIPKTSDMAVASRRANKPIAERVAAGRAPLGAPTGEDPGALRFIPVIGSAITVGSFLSNIARKNNLEVVGPTTNPGDPRGLPGEGRDGNERRTRLRIAGAGDEPIVQKPLTGSADEDDGEGSENRRKKRPILGAANVRKPMLTAGSGATFLGRAPVGGRTILG